MSVCADDERSRLGAEPASLVPGADFRGEIPTVAPIETDIGFGVGDAGVTPWWGTTGEGACGFVTTATI